MSRVKVLLVATYDGMEKISRELAETRTDLDVRIVHGTLKDGVRAAMAEYDDSFDAIISRGGTTELLRQVFPIPVVDIEFSAIDMIRMVKMADRPSVKKAIVGSRSIAYIARMVCELLGQTICIRTLTSEEKPEEQLEKLREAGYNYVIGDVCVNKVALEMGFESALWTSGTDSIRKAMDEASVIGRTVKQIRRYSNMCRSMLDQSRSCLFVEDEKQEVLYDNLPYQNEWKTRLIRQLRDVGSSGKDVHIFIEEDDGCWDGVIRHLTDDSGRISLYSFYKHSEEDTLPVVSNYISLRSAKEVCMCIGRDGSGGIVPNLMEEIEAVGKALLPVLIAGESGLKKTTVAYAMHQQSAIHEGAFLLADCSRLELPVFEQYFGGEWLMESCPDGATICFQQLDALPAESQNALSRFVKTCTQGDKYRIISTTELPVEEFMRDRKFSRRLYNQMSELHLQLEPLRNDRDRLEMMTDYFIRQYNEKYGSQVIGFEADAIEVIRRYDWPGNIRQLCAVLLRLVIGNSNFYISAEEMRGAIAEDDRRCGRERGGQGVDMEQSLGGIVHDVIARIVAEEGGNQSRAAKRLEISRSTIWRILRE